MTSPTEHFQFGKTDSFSRPGSTMSAGKPHSTMVSDESGKNALLTHPITTHIAGGQVWLICSPER